MGKDAYFATFEVLNAQSEICDSFEKIGLSFEYGIGTMGVALEALINQSFTILKDSIGVNVNPQHRKININGYVQNVQFDVFFVGDYDENFTITEDDFSEFVFKAVKCPKLQDLFWRAMVEKDEDAREQFNGSSKDFQISNYWKR